MIRNTITGTHPVHLHANGGSHVLGWAKPFFKSMSLQQQSWKPPEPRRDAGELEIVTCSNFPPGDTAVEKSCRYWGVPIVRLAPIEPGPWKHYWRFKMGIEHCSRTSADWLLFTDATDAIFVRHPYEALEELHHLGAAALLSAEHNSWPADCKVPPGQGTYPNGNGGGYMGSRAMLLELLEEADRYRSMDRPDDDQFGLRMAAHALGVPLDAEARVFQTLAFTQPGEVVAVS